MCFESGNFLFLDIISDFFISLPSTRYRFSCNNCRQTIAFTGPISRGVSLEKRNCPAWYYVRSGNQDLCWRFVFRVGSVHLDKFGQTKRINIDSHVTWRMEKSIDKIFFRLSRTAVLQYARSLATSSKPPVSDSIDKLLWGPKKQISSW